MQRWIVAKTNIASIFLSFFIVFVLLFFLYHFGE